MADGHAVQELLKIATILYEATKHSEPSSEENEGTDALQIDSEMLSKVSYAYLNLTRLVWCNFYFIQVHVMNVD